MRKSTSVHLRKIKRPTNDCKVKYEWHLRWHGTDGKHYCKKLDDCSKMTKREAEKHRRDFQTELDRKEVPRNKARPMTLEEFCKFHEQTIGDTRKPSTKYEYRLAIQHACNALGKDRLISNIATSDAGRIQSKMTASATSKGKVIGRLRAMFNRAKDWELVTDNPFTKQPMPPPKSSKKRIFDLHEIDAMIKVAPTLWWKAFIQLGYTSGLRLKEILNLQWRDVDLKDASVIVVGKDAEDLQTPDGTSYRTLSWSPKTHQKRSVPIPETTVAILNKLKSTTDGSPYCFISLDRLVILEDKRQAGILRERFEVVNNVLRSFKVIQLHAAKTLDVKEWEIGTVHDLRRSYGTRIADAVPMHVLMKWMGHSDISVTANYYLDVSDHHAEKARGAFGAMR